MGNIFKLGDRVVLIVDNPSGAHGLPAGTRGTVADEGSEYSVGVFWDDFDNGHDLSSGRPVHNGWWVGPEEIGYESDNLGYEDSSKDMDEFMESLK